MFVDYLKALSKYKRNGDVLSLRTLDTLKTEILRDIHEAFEMGQPFVDDNPTLYDESSSFVDFMFKLLRDEKPRRSCAAEEKVEERTTRAKCRSSPDPVTDDFSSQPELSTALRDGQASLEDAVRKLTADICTMTRVVEQKYQRDTQALAAESDTLKSQLEVLHGTMGNFNECFAEVKRMASTWKEKMEAAWKSLEEAKCERLRFSSEAARLVAPSESVSVENAISTAAVPDWNTQTIQQLRKELDEQNLDFENIKRAKAELETSHRKKEEEAALRDSRLRKENEKLKQTAKEQLRENSRLVEENKDLEMQMRNRVAELQGKIDWYQRNQNRNVQTDPARMEEGAVLASDSQLRESLFAKETQLQKVVFRKEALEKTVKEQQRENARLLEKNKEHQLEVEKLRVKNELDKSENVALRSEISSLRIEKRQNEISRQRYAPSSERIDRKNEMEIESLKESIGMEKEDYEFRNKMLDSSIKTLDKNLQDCLEMKANQKIEISQLVVEKQKIEKENIALKEKIKASEEEFNQNLRNLSEKYENEKSTFKDFEKKEEDKQKETEIAQLKEKIERRENEHRKDLEEKETLNLQSQTKKETEIAQLKEEIELRENEHRKDLEEKEMLNLQSQTKKETEIAQLKEEIERRKNEHRKDLEEKETIILNLQSQTMKETEIEEEEKSGDKFENLKKMYHEELQRLIDREEVLKETYRKENDKKREMFEIQKTTYENEILLKDNYIQQLLLQITELNNMLTDRNITIVQQKKHIEEASKNYTLEQKTDNTIEDDGKAEIIQIETRDFKTDFEEKVLKIQELNREISECKLNQNALENFVYEVKKFALELFSPSSYPKNKYQWLDDWKKVYSDALDKLGKLVTGLDSTKPFEYNVDQIYIHVKKQKNEIESLSYPLDDVTTEENNLRSELRRQQASKDVTTMTEDPLNDFEENVYGFWNKLDEKDEFMTYFEMYKGYTEVPKRKKFVQEIIKEKRYKPYFEYIEKLNNDLETLEKDVLNMDFDSDSDTEIKKEVASSSNVEESTSKKETETSDKEAFSSMNTIDVLKKMKSRIHTFKNKFKIKQLQVNALRRKKNHHPFKKKQFIRKKKISTASEKIILNKSTTYKKIVVKLQNTYKDFVSLSKSTSLGQWEESFINKVNEVLEKVNHLEEKKNRLRTYIKFIFTKLLAFQDRNLPPLNEPVECSRCKSNIDSTFTPHRFECDKNHVYHKQCLTDEFDDTNFEYNCRVCEKPLFPDMKYYYVQLSETDDDESTVKVMGNKKRKIEENEEWNELDKLRDEYNNIQKYLVECKETIKKKDKINSIVNQQKEKIKKLEINIAANDIKSHAQLTKIGELETLLDIQRKKELDTQMKIEDEYSVLLDDKDKINTDLSNKIYDLESTVKMLTDQTKTEISDKVTLYEGEGSSSPIATSDESMTTNENLKNIVYILYVEYFILMDKVLQKSGEKSAKLITSIFKNLEALNRRLSKKHNHLVLKILTEFFYKHASLIHPNLKKNEGEIKMPDNLRNFVEFLVNEAKAFFVPTHQRRDRSRSPINDEESEYKQKCPTCSRYKRREDSE